MGEPKIQPRIQPSNGLPDEDQRLVDVTGQKEDIDVVPSELLAEARAARDAAFEIGADIQPLPEEKQTPGYSKYFYRAWKYIQGVFYKEPDPKQLVAENTSQQEYSAEQEAQRQQRRELFEVIDGICSDLDKGRQNEVDEIIGRTITVRQNSYTVKEKLGQGGLGITFIVEDATSGQARVMKISHSFNRAAMYRNPDDLMEIEKSTSMVDRLLGKKKTIKQFRWTQDQLHEAAVARRQIVEVASLYRLTREGKKHAFKDRTPDGVIVPRLYDAQFLSHPDDSSRRINVVVMEKIEGKTLSNTLNETGLPDSPDEVVKVAKDLLDSTQHIHAAGGVLHLDLKPENVILTPEGRVAFVDFGLSDVENKKVADAGEEDDAIEKRRINPNRPRPVYAQPIEAELSGTPSYFVRKEPISPARDAFGIGRILHDMIYGKQLAAKSTEERISAFQNLPKQLQVVSRVAEHLITYNVKNRSTLPQAQEQLESELSALQ